MPSDRSPVSAEFRRPLALLIGLQLCTAVAGLWLGEHGSSPFPIESIGALALLITAAVVLLQRLGLSLPLGVGATIALFVLIWLAGANESTLAFNECVREGETAREKLAIYRGRTGRFPETLAELDTHLPGNLTLPPDILHYRRTPQGYRLIFQDWLVRHRASESEPFLATK